MLCFVKVLSKVLLFKHIIYHIDKLSLFSIANPITKFVVLLIPTGSLNYSCNLHYSFKPAFLSDTVVLNEKFDI